MSDTSPAIPESIDPANQHKALTAGQQAVIKKLFRRLIVFLFVLFIFSFLFPFRAASRASAPSWSGSRRSRWR